MKIRYTNKKGVQTFAIIQERNIERNGKDFGATYKDHDIFITTDHGHGKPKEKGLKRFDIVVMCESGMYAVNTWEDLPNLRSAIKYALVGSMLIETNSKSFEENNFIED